MNVSMRVEISGRIPVGADQCYVVASLQLRGWTNFLLCCLHVAKKSNNERELGHIRLLICFAETIHGTLVLFHLFYLACQCQEVHELRNSTSKP